MNVPGDLRYAKTHEWVKFDASSGHAVIGITNHAQCEMGDIVFAEVVLELGDTVTANQELAEIESVKAVSEVLAPVGGTVVAVNEALADSPELLNQDPYGNWIAELEGVEAADFDALMDSSAYEALIAE